MGFKKAQPIYCLQEIHLTYMDTEKLKVNVQVKKFSVNMNQKEFVKLNLQKTKQTLRKNDYWK